MVILYDVKANYLPSDADEHHRKPFEGNAVALFKSTAPTSTQKNEKKGAAKYDNCAGNKSKSCANIPVIPSFIADLYTQRWSNGQTTPNPQHRLSKSQFRTESQKTKTKMFLSMVLAKALM